MSWSVVKRGEHWRIFTVGTQYLCIFLKHWFKYRSFLHPIIGYPRVHYCVCVCVCCSMKTVLRNVIWIVSFLCWIFMWTLISCSAIRRYVVALFSPESSPVQWLLPPHTHTHKRAAFFFPISIRETRRKKCIGALFDFHTLSHQRGYLQLFFSDWNIVTGLCLVLSLWPFLSNRIISSRAHVDISEETRRGVPFDKHTHTRGLWRHTHTHTKQQPGPRHHDEWNSHFSPLPPLRYCDHHDICLIL